MKHRKPIGRKKVLIWALIVILIIIVVSIITRKSIINNWNLKSEFSKNYSTVVDGVEYSLTIDDNVVYENSIELKIKIDDEDETSKYKIKVSGENESENLFESECEKEDSIKIPLYMEGEIKLIIQIFRNDEEKVKIDRTIYYIQPYERQFLDELSNKSIQVHYIDGTWEKYEKSIEMINYSGFRNIKSSFLWRSIERNNQYNFEYYDKWIKRADELGLNIYGCINQTGEHGGENKILDTPEEIEHFSNFVKVLSERYPNIKRYDVLNEPNLTSANNGGYITEEDVYWYSEAVKEASKNNHNVNLIIGGLSNYDTSTSSRLAMNDFFTYLYNNGVIDIFNELSYHVYDYTNQAQQDVILSKTLKEEEDLFNNFGGFIKTNITEYGLSSNDNNKITEDIQARKLVQQTVTMDKYCINFANLYLFWNTGNDSGEHEYNFGIVNNDYTPKKSYYSLKQLLTNINGAEYIGTVDLADGLEAHVYDKDGKPKIIAWSGNSNNTINIPYENFTASDIYGNEIENTNGTLEITTSPVYLDNISNKYFYEAISNTAISKYAEFEEKFSEEIAKIDGMDTAIENFKDYMESIKNNTLESQDTAIQKLSKHFNLGNMILEAYKNGKLDVEYVKISSMLDMLNDIGYSYEDLLTVSATTREPYFTATNELIEKTEKVINDNTDLEIIYPSKILDFSKDLHEKAEYINGLEEENDIKTGLIVSNSLHAYYLADWANEFAQIYIDEYINSNPVTLSYSNTDEFTNQDVIATLNIGSDSKVTNNEGKNTYTFSQNGEFTFEYERRGQAYKLEATVSNIDKDSPNITGVENGKIYTNEVIPIITDENLLSVEVLFNGEKVDYIDKMKFTDEGIYDITATDKAGNVTNIEFYIVENKNSGYIIKDNYILNIKQKTSTTDFGEKFKINMNYEIFNGEEVLDSEDTISTGNILKLENGEEYVIIVAGDINGDGKVTTFDLSALRRSILGLKQFNEIEALAADINLDGQALGVKDYTRIRIEILGKY